MRARNPDEDETKFLLRLSKKGKGAVDMVLAQRVLALIGFSIQPTLIALDLDKHNDGKYIVESMLKPWAESHDLRFVSDPRYGDPKIWELRFGDRGSPRVAAEELLDLVEIVERAPDEAVVGQLYMTQPSAGRDRITAKHMWLGAEGRIVTAPSGKSATIPSPVDRHGLPVQGPVNIASLWTFLYKNGAAEAAKAYLDTVPEQAEDLARPKAERERIAQMRRALPEIAAIFREVTDERYQLVLEYLYARYIAQMDAVVRMQAAGKKFQHAEYQAAMRLMDTVYEAGRGYIYVPKADYEKIARSYAKRDADEARELFVHKNTTRISEIARRKDALPTSELLTMRGGGKTGYDSEILFTFPDGSSFELRNKTVWKTSPLGKFFAQFPTTFHNVILPNGKKMPPPLSEARMLDVFAGGKAENPDRWQLVTARRLARGG